MQCTYHSGKKAWLLKRETGCIAYTDGIRVTQQREIERVAVGELESLWLTISQVNALAETLEGIKGNGHKTAEHGKAKPIKEVAENAGPTTR